MKRHINEYLIPDRHWIATITYQDGRKITASLYGRNCTDAEDRYRRDHPEVRVIIVHQECWR